ncbi:MAG TPA: hypothetical protein VFX64_02680 [Candidatus Nitrosotalea sp.]|nr:hypothetical protein [Candidatus Nitrosotalea sp.]
MSYGQYPFWLKNQADNASASASSARYEAENAKKIAQELDEKHSKCVKKLVDISNEMSQYRASKTKDEMRIILENIKKIVSTQT